MFRILSLQKFGVVVLLVALQQAGRQPAAQPQVVKPEAAAAPVERAVEPTLVVTKAGYFLLVQDAAGNPSLQRIGKVINLGDPGSNPPDPTDPPAERLRQAVTTALAAVTEPNKANSQKAMAKLYLDVAEIAGPETLDQAKQFLDLLFVAIQPNLSPQWVQWKTKVDAAVESFAAGDVNKYREALAMVAKTLDPAVQASDGDVIEQVDQLRELIREGE